MHLIGLIFLACLCLSFLITGFLVPSFVSAGEVSIPEAILFYAIEIVILYLVFVRPVRKAIKNRREVKEWEKRDEEISRFNMAQNMRFSEIENAVRQLICMMFSINAPRLDVELNALFEKNPQLKYGKYIEDYQKEDWFIRKDKLDTVIDLIEERLQRKRIEVELCDIWICPYCGSINFNKFNTCCVCIRDRE